MVIFKIKFDLKLIIAAISLAGILLHFLLLAPFYVENEFYRELPLYLVLLFGGMPLIFELLQKAWRKEFGSDLLAGISIITSILLDQHLAGSFVVLMLSGGEALEEYAVQRASSALSALAKRIPEEAFKLLEDQSTIPIAVEQIEPGDNLIVPPHQIVPVDGVVKIGHSTMDESFLTGEPFLIRKTPGSTVISGAINGENIITICATKKAIDSRYARIIKVMEESAQNRPQIRRVADRLGALYTPLAVIIAILAWIISGDSLRFLSVLIVATPCPLIIAIPVAIIGAISLAAKRGIVIRNPAAMEVVPKCKNIVFDKTGTLTYGRPTLTELIPLSDFTEKEIVGYLASIEQYSKHPLAGAVMDYAQKNGIEIKQAQEISEKPGEGLRGIIENNEIVIFGRKSLAKYSQTENLSKEIEYRSGLECFVAINDKLAALIRFHDAPRSETSPFIAHLSKKHKFDRVVLLSGDRQSEVEYLAQIVGIKEVHHSKSPEEKVAIVKELTDLGPTIFVGDGINDAPALTIATVGIGIGQGSEITSSASDLVIMEPSLAKVDEFFHISERMLSIIKQSAYGGMITSIGGMILASFGLLTPVAGAITQELIDLFAVSNALRTLIPPKQLTDY